MALFYWCCRVDAAVSVCIHMLVDLFDVRHTVSATDTMVKRIVGYFPLIA